VGIVTSVTVIGETTLPAPGVDSEIVPVTVVDAFNPLGFTLIEMSRPPLPEAGLTCSHHWLDEAVQLMGVPAVCVSRTVCAEVCAVTCAPLNVAPYRSDDRSMLTIGPVPNWLTVNVWPAIVSDPDLKDTPFELTL
jgi:hypothetical protein